MSAEAGDQIIDTRDLITRIDELGSRAECEEAQGPNDNDACDACGALYLDEEERDELASLRELSDTEIADWQHGATLIREDHFEEFAQQLAEDIGAIDSEAGWPLSCIDWKQAAEQLAMDYMTVTFGGYDYYVRS